MENEVGAFEAKTHLSKLLDRVKEGQAIYITRRGKRVVRRFGLEMISADSIFDDYGLKRRW